jgi:hypothetical protein
MTVKDCKETLENFESGFENILAEHGKCPDRILTSC